MSLERLFQKLPFGHVCLAPMKFNFKAQRSRNFAYKHHYRDFCKQQELISLVL